MQGPTQPQRRIFFKIASAGTLASTTAGIPALLVSQQALAEETVGKSVFSTLVTIARDIFPHDRFGNELYVKAVADYSNKVGKDRGLRKSLIEGVKVVDATAKKHHHKTYSQLSDEKTRVDILRGMQETPFFTGLRGALVVSLYNQPAVWAKLGYQGASAEHGGYIQRGFNDQSWMESQG